MDSLRIFRVTAVCLIYTASNTTCLAIEANAPTSKETATLPEPVLLAIIGGSLLAIGLLMRYRARKLQQRNSAERKSKYEPLPASSTED